MTSSAACVCTLQHCYVCTRSRCGPTMAQRNRQSWAAACAHCTMMRAVMTSMLASAASFGCHMTPSARRCTLMPGENLLHRAVQWCQAAVFMICRITYGVLLFSFEHYRRLGSEVLASMYWLPCSRVQFTVCACFTTCARSCHHACSLHSSVRGGPVLRCMPHTTCVCAFPPPSERTAKHVYARSLQLHVRAHCAT